MAHMQEAEIARPQHASRSRVGPLTVFCSQSCITTEIKHTWGRHKNVFSFAIFTRLLLSFLSRINNWNFFYFSKTWTHGMNPFFTWLLFHKSACVYFISGPRCTAVKQTCKNKLQKRRLWFIPTIHFTLPEKQRSPTLWAERGEGKL